ncbi:hypothetical protein CPC08DRAFT_762380 [Agrocybe pediades]|nr:hypothetical protein CPC08DRAFT_762380 [Agrocybe pediades]
MVEWWMIASCNIALTPPTASMVNGGEPIRPYDHPVPTVNLYPYAPSAHSPNSSHTEMFMRTTSTGSSHSEVFNGPTADEDNYEDYAVNGESNDGHTVLDDDDFADEMRPHNTSARESYKGSFSEASEGGSVLGADVKVTTSLIQYDSVLNASPLDSTFGVSPESREKVYLVAVQDADDA